MKLGSKTLDAVEVNFELSNFPVVNVLSWNDYVVVVYRPPFFGTSENVALSRLLVNFGFGKDVIVVGDFKIPSLHWNKKGELSNDYVSPLYRSFMNTSWRVV